MFDLHALYHYFSYGEMLSGQLGAGLVNKHFSICLQIVVIFIVNSTTTTTTAATNSK